MRPEARYSLAGTRAPVEEGQLRCSSCKSPGAPALLLLHHLPGKDLKPVHRLCLPCVGRAVEQATGWKVLRAWSQWLASSKLGMALRPHHDDPWGV